MTERVRQMIRCPACGDCLTDGAAPPNTGGEGGYQCLRCRRFYPIQDGVPRMLVSPAEEQHAARSFGFQWLRRASGNFERDTLYGLTKEQERAAFFQAYGVTPRDLKGKTVLDAGCGDGALLEILADDGCEVVGMDINTSITVPYQRCRHLPNVTVLQSDVFHPCFAPGSFDFVWCEGVVVHTADATAAFRSVSRLVRPGGLLYIWVYPSDRLSIYQRTRDLLVAPYLIPRPALFYMCYGIAGCMVPILHLTGRRRSLGTVAFDLFDNLSPRYQWRYTVPEISSWFRDAGFDDLKVTGQIGISGRRVA